MAKTTHGKWKSKEWNSWNHMKGRCNNPNNPKFKDYGERGMSVWKRWAKFENFYEDMGDAPSKSHSLDRIDNEGNYEPSNCRWATPEEQSNNRRANRKSPTINKRPKEKVEGFKRIGAANGRTKLTDEDIRALLFLKPGNTLTRLAQLFNVNISTVSRAIKRQQFY
jgi:hypothetical protein